MRVTPITDNLIQLDRFPRVFPVSCYLVREDDGFTLIDSGFFGGAKAILAAARQHDREIRRIVLSHAHTDHVGSVDALHEALPGAEVAISARDARFLAGDKRLDSDEPQTKPRGSFSTIRTRPTRLLAHGDRVGSLQVVAAPGHTPGHVAFLDDRDNTLIAGDAFQTRGGIAVTGVLRPTFPFPALATWHRPTALRTAFALRALHPARLAVGHGRVLDDPIPAIDRAIEAARRKAGNADS
jgi:glyoxylase-like metal-dependent hydrolase (beta-lactamase superfamily II)